MKFQDLLKGSGIDFTITKLMRHNISNHNVEKRKLDTKKFGLNNN